MKAKRTIAAISAFAMLLSLVSCGKTNSSDISETKESSSEVQTVTNEMRDMTSLELVHDMKLGYNLGNSLDVCNADRNGDGKADETSDNVDETLWGNPTVTKEQIQFVKDSGFDSVRIPVTWRDHIYDAGNIDAAWMDRVQEVVDYAYDLDMYVIINVHHDGGGDPDFGAWIRNASTDYDAVSARYKTIWQQICDRFEDYGDKLLFESMNEVGFDDMSKNDAYNTLNSLNQEFVDLVRASGGNNSKRHLVIAGYWTDIAMTCNRLYKMPDDPANRCILSVHYYTPWDFCTCTVRNDWGTESDISEMEGKVSQLTSYYTDKGVPVIIGEYGTCRGNNEDDRVEFCKRFVTLCHAAQIPTFIWDDGGLFERADMRWQNQEMIDAINEAVK